MQKKLLLAVAVAGAVAAPAAMADVHVSGLVDVGIQSVSPGSGYAGSKQVVQDNMGAGGSRLNFSAKEDLGGGMFAIGVAELGWNIDSGAGDSAATGSATCAGNVPINTCTDTSLSVSNGTSKTFQRQTYAGLGGGWGTLTVGRQYRETFLVGAVSSYNYTASGTGIFFLNGNTGVRQDNDIKYTSPTIGGGLTLAASYAPGEGTTANTKDNDKWQEVAAKWRSGPLSINAAAGTSTSMTTGTGVDTKTTIVGGSYAFGPATVYALYSKSTTDNGPELKATSVTGKYTVGKGDIVLALGKRTVNASNSDSSFTGLGYFHWLSKTTDVFVTYGKMSNDSAVPVSLAGVPRQGVATTTAGEDPSAISVGWVQRF